MSKHFTENQAVLIRVGSLHNSQVRVRNGYSVPVPKPAVFVRYMAGDVYAIVRLPGVPAWPGNGDAHIRVLVTDLSAS